ncbi:protein tyrosine phosphatase [Flexistipes sinusarabici DSM 4947]|uniref:Protein tyrosine phosphatase n=1 Tax=Flexistipes sinusarabici (strain ATCC 49648 / DSM 4947 / MAS 10) TaxID=717231 RepID=F8E6C3_FLESM|nr:arsenate reductase ArsC [Flexistipes sinusarabici]AEI15890.1 protein tyrosine phosphatase [Flexistipes sinusarabici DSM 4947]
MAISKKLLFLCTGNSCRSQMAEAYGKNYLKNYDVYSAGQEKHGLNPYMLKVMKEDGYEMQGHYSKTLNDVNDIDFDVVVTVCGHANETCPMYLKKAQIIHKGFDDPAQVTGSDEEILGQFRKVRDEIKSYIKNELSKII